MTEGKNDNVNQSMRQMLGKSQAATQPLGTPNAPEAASDAPGTPKADMDASMRQMLDRGRSGGAGGLDAGTIAFHVAARKAGAKDAAALYRAAQDRVVMDLTGGVVNDMDALMSDLKREDPAAFLRFTIDGGARLGNATGDARTPNPAQGSDLARASLDIQRRFRND